MLDVSHARQLCADSVEFESPLWFQYNNAIELWQRLLRRPVSEDGALCQGNEEDHAGGGRRRRGLMLTILTETSLRLVGAPASSSDLAVALRGVAVEIRNHCNAIDEVGLCHGRPGGRGGPARRGEPPDAPLRWGLFSLLRLRKEDRLV